MWIISSIKREVMHGVLYNLFFMYFLPYSPIIHMINYISDSLNKSNLSIVNNIYQWSVLVLSGYLVIIYYDMN